MVKTLVLLPGYFQDFRTELIATYEKDYKIFRGDFSIHANRIIVNQSAINKKDCLIFNREGVKYGGLGRELLLSDQGFIVDTPTFSANIASSKEVLFAFLNRFGARTPPVYYSAIPPSPFYLEYSNEETLRVEVVSNKTRSPSNVFSTSVMCPWDGPIINGYLVYFYLFEPLFCSTVRWSSLDQISVRMDKAYFNIMKTASKVGYEYHKIGINKDTELQLDELGSLSSPMLETLKIIPKALRAPSCEVLLARNLDGQLILLNVEVHHEPLTLFLYSTIDLETKFLNGVKQRFLDFMEITQ